MRDQKVTIETAILAEQKGFDWDCLYAFSSKNPEDIHTAYDLTGENTFTKEDCEAAYSNAEDKHYLCPTLSLLLRWLREEHGVNNLHVFPFYTNDILRGFKPFRGLLLTHRLHEFNKLKNHDSYEKALEHGIVDCLNDLKDA